jgi:TetR/AcrR family transcriptional regulator, repressor of fatR-cypB operon
VNIHSVTKSDDVLDAALDLFERRGYGSAPVALVAEAAKVGAGTIYRYFPGKEGVVNALYRRWKSALADAVTDGLDNTAASRETFEGIWRRLCAFAIEEPAAFAFLETHHHRPYLDEASRSVAADIDAAMSELVSTWQRRGDVRAGDPALLVAQVFGGLIGVARSYRDRDESLPANVAEQTLDGAWAVLAASKPKGKL